MVKYTIKKTKHYAKFTLNRLFPFVGRKITGRVKFSNSCIIPESIAGWNKLTGISGLRIHNNSGRLVWRGNGRVIRIAGYVYKNGTRHEQAITYVHPEMWYDYSVEYKDGYWHLEIDGKSVVLAGHLSWVGIKFRCFPYFGGQSTPTEDIIIHMGK